MTLEYAIDDFSIAQLAQSLGDTSVYEDMMQRAHNWEYLFNPAAGTSRPGTPTGASRRARRSSRHLFEPGGEQGFEEGNAIQYTWSVPQDLAALGEPDGRDASAATRS